MLLPLLFAVVAAMGDVGPGLFYLHLLRRHPGPAAAAETRPTSIRYLVAAASGIVIAAAIFELLPEANLDKNAPYVALGFFAFYLVEKLVMLHSCGEAECDSHLHRLSWLAGAGMASDNVVDGVGITAATLTSPWLGLAVAVAVVAHEVPQGFTTAVLARESGWSLRKSAALVGFAGIMYPAGALLAFLLPAASFPPVLAAVAGLFLYVGAADLLAEAHRTFNLRVILSVLMGALLMFGLSRLGVG